MIQIALGGQAGTIRFHRWNRKKYAMFCSVRRCVTIGCVCKSIADAALSKVKQALMQGYAGNAARRGTDEPKTLSADGTCINVPDFRLEEELCLAVLCSQRTDVVKSSRRSGYGFVNNINKWNTGKSVMCIG